MATIRKSGIIMGHYEGSLTLKLSNKEKQVLQLIASGLSDKEIANELKISYRTVQTYVRNINLKFSSLNRTHSVALAIRNNII